MNKNKELIKLFISFMCALTIMIIVLIMQTNINDADAIETMAQVKTEQTNYTQVTRCAVHKPVHKPKVEVEEVIIEKEPEPIFEEFEATAYCACVKCCGIWADGITASGTTATAKRTIAVDPKIIPLGTQVEIEGLGIYTAEDTGSAIKGKIVDIYFNTHEEALKFGRQKVNVRILPSDGGN